MIIERQQNQEKLQHKNNSQDQVSVKRIQSVDVFRLVAIIMVIALHVQPFHLYSPVKNALLYKYLDRIIDNLARFAVPFFFVISGYFWGAKTRNGEDLIAYSLLMIRRISIVFFFWCIIYLIPYNQVGLHNGISEILKLTTENINTLLHKPIILLMMQGSKGHLWFLVALMFSIGISALFIHNKAEKGLAVLSLTLYIFGVLAKAYANTPIGMSIDFNTRNGPFLGTVFFVAGYFMSGLKTSYKWLLYGLLVFILGCAVHFSEILILWKMFNVTDRQDYVFGTLFMGIGIAMIALSNHPMLQNKLVARFGQMTLGVYVIHFIFIELFSGFSGRYSSSLWGIGYVIVVLILSLLSTYLLSMHKFTKFLVM